MDELKQILTFDIAEHQMAFNVSDVVVVTRALKITSVVKSVGFFEGMINLWGKLTPVINLNIMFGFADRKSHGENYLIAVKAKKNIICILLEHMPKLKHIQAENLEAPPEIMLDQYVETVYKKDDSLIMILNAEKLVDPDEIKQLITGKKNKLFVDETC